VATAKPKRSPSRKGASTSKQPVTAVVYGYDGESFCIRPVGSTEVVHFVPESKNLPYLVAGELASVTLGRTTTYEGFELTRGKIHDCWLDVPALGLTALPLHDRGDGEFEFDGVARGEGVGEHPDYPGEPLAAVAGDVAQYHPESAMGMLMVVLRKDLRCTAAHGNYGQLFFSTEPVIAERHFHVAVVIARASLPKGFQGRLPHSLLNNRPFLRALHGLGLCHWRLGHPEKARPLFEYLVALEPDDPLEGRQLIDDIDRERPWPGMTVPDALL